MKQTSVKKGLTVKDLVTVGVFSALFPVFALVGGIFLCTESGTDLLYVGGQRITLRNRVFDIPFSRQQLADYLAVKRSGLSLELGKMRNEGLLDYYKNHFLLKV